MAAVARALVYLSLCLSLCQGRNYIPMEMNRTIQNLLQHYKIPHEERFNGKPVFSRELLAGKLEAKQMFLGAVLETYEKLIDQMLQQLPTPSPRDASAASVEESGTSRNVRTELTYVLNKVKELRTHRYQEEKKLLRGLHALKHIQVENLVIQSKALWELPWLYEEASSLADIKNQRRRRRQARRVKTRPRA